MNVPKTHDNAQPHAFLTGYHSVAELCDDYPRLDDILSGALALRTEGNRTTRGLSRKVLFTILRCCETIDTPSISATMSGRYEDSTLRAYASTARVASKAIGAFLEANEVPGGVGAERLALDQPYLDDLDDQIRNANLLKGSQQNLENSELDDQLQSVTNYGWDAESFDFARQRRIRPTTRNFSLSRLVSTQH